jgi:hypothetical protein
LAQSATFALKPEMKTVLKTGVLTAIIAWPAWASAQDLISISGISKTVKINPSVLTPATLKALGRDGKERSYTGVLLADLLSAGGIALGNKQQSVRSYIVINAKDNYKSIFSLAEIDPIFSPSKILVAFKIDEQPLDASDAPFQIIVPQDKIPTRWVKQVVSIKLISPD